MDLERIKLLLDVFHSSLDVPHTNNIRDEIMKELRDHNAGEVPVVFVPEEAEPELKIEGRRI